MRFFIRLAVILIILIGVIGGVGYWLSSYWKGLNKPKFRTASVSRGKIVTVVNATGTIKPEKTIKIGAVVSGPIIKIWAKPNQRITVGQDLAYIDPRKFKTAWDARKAQITIQLAEKGRIAALLNRANNNLKRLERLRAIKREYVTDAEWDQARFDVMAFEEQKKFAEASYKQAIDNEKTAKVEWEFTKIKSPVNGVVIERKIEPGQSLASAFQTPELFVVAESLQTMHIHATVDEADIAHIMVAKQKQLQVNFTVDSQPDSLFTGRIIEVRKNSTTTQNVVTYPVIVEIQNPKWFPNTPRDPHVALSGVCALNMFGASFGQAPLFAAYTLIPDNPEYKFFPDMTANLSFRTDEAKEVLRIPNAALRFYPQKEHVRSEDHHILDGANARKRRNDDDEQEIELTAAEKTEMRRESRTRHVWIRDGDLLRAIEVVTGISNNRYTQIVSGDLEEGQELVTGLKK